MPRNNFNNSQKTFIWSRQKGICGICGADLSDEVDIEYHHVLNCKDGGMGIVENAVMLCEVCHLHCHDNDFKKPVLVFRTEFKYANWEENSYYRGRKKGKEVEFTKKTLDEFDKQGEKIIMEDNSYEKHLAMLVGFRQQLKVLKGQIEQTAEQYRVQINGMEKAGFMKNHIEPLRTRYATFRVRVEELEDLIVMQTRKITQHEEIIQGLIDQLKWRG